MAWYLTQLIKCIVISLLRFIVRKHFLESISSLPTGKTKIFFYTVEFRMFVDCGKNCPARSFSVISTYSNADVTNNNRNIINENKF